MEAQNMNDSGVDETIVDTTRPSQRQVPTVSRTPDLQQFRSEASRLETFRSWTHRYPMQADLAMLVLFPIVSTACTINDVLDL